MPLLFSLEGKKVLLIGAGAIGQRKLEKLLNYTSSITIMTKECSHSMKKIIHENKLILITKSYEPNDVKDYDIIIATIDNLDLQKSIYQEAKKYSKLYNCVDFPEYCDFMFPSIVQKGDLQIAFSTGGYSPGLAKALRALFERIIPDAVIPFLEEMKVLRKMHPKGENRQKIFHDKVNVFVKQHFIMPTNGEDLNGKTR